MLVQDTEQLGLQGLGHSSWSSIEVKACERDLLTKLN